MDWNKKYDVEGYYFGTEPNTFLASHADMLVAGTRALAVADGEGKNGVWLARQGLDVLSLDGSSVAQEKARALAAARGVTIETECADLLDWDWPTDAFDVIAVLHFHATAKEREALHRQYREALKPGGLLIMEVFHPDQLGLGTGGPDTVDRLIGVDELERDFAGMDFVTLRKADVTLAPRPKHPTHRPGIVSQLTARRV